MSPFLMLARIIRQGRQEGTFDVEDPDVTGLLLLHMMNAVGEIQTRGLLAAGHEPEKLVILHRRANLYIGFIERILGIPEASLTRVDLGVFEIAELINRQTTPDEPLHMRHSNFQSKR